MLDQKAYETKDMDSLCSLSLGLAGSIGISDISTIIFYDSSQGNRWGDNIFNQILNNVSFPYLLCLGVSNKACSYSLNNSSMSFLVSGVAGRCGLRLVRRKYCHLWLSTSDFIKVSGYQPADVPLEGKRSPPSVTSRCKWGLNVHLLELV